MEANKCLYEGKKNIHPTSHKILHRTDDAGRPNCKERQAVRSQCAGHPLTNLISVGGGPRQLGLLKPPGDYKVQAQVRSVGPAPPPTKQPWSSHWTRERSICWVSSRNTVPSFQETFKAHSFPAHLVYWLTLIVLTGIKSPLVPQGDLLLKKIISFFAL